MARKKQRTFQHIMENESYEIIRSHLPKEWVIREFNNPDYGVDLVIELFEKIDQNISETLGEFLYIQVKSTKKIAIETEKIYAVGNVAKGIWKEDKSEYIDLKVAKYKFDTNSIYSIHSIGSSVCILLFYVDIENKDVYFMNMNDYIEKLLVPKNKNYGDQQSITIKIPALNNLKNQQISISALEFYGKRAKLLAAFSKFSYQKNELGYVMGFMTWPVKTYRSEIEKDFNYSSDEVYNLTKLFIRQIEDLEIWKFSAWPPLPEMWKELQALKSYLNSKVINWDIARDKIIIIWHQLNNLGTMYEDICREWFLPKMIGLLCSYPEQPNIIKANVLKKGKAKSRD
ncbi:MAG: DUF4365 domain-containing protein [Sphingobacteriales bacterium]|nr:MAG: DUF4365 domain-containing protein [Sphingobacteriales bacterium]